MPVFFNARLVHVGHPKPFMGKDGESVEYFINTIAHDAGVLTINSKRDFSEHIDIPSMITLALREQMAVADNRSQKLYRVSLIDISPLGSDEDEKTVR